MDEPDNKDFLLGEWEAEPDNNKSILFQSDDEMSDDDAIGDEAAAALLDLDAEAPDPGGIMDAADGNNFMDTIINSSQLHIRKEQQVRTMYEKHGFIGIFTMFFTPP